jgi:hypothetical protein
LRPQPDRPSLPPAPDAARSVCACSRGAGGREGGYQSTHSGRAGGDEFAVGAHRNERGGGRRVWQRVSGEPLARARRPRPLPVRVWPHRRNVRVRPFGTRQRTNARQRARPRRRYL